MFVCQLGSAVYIQSSRNDALGLNGQLQLNMANVLKFFSTSNQILLNYMTCNINGNFSDLSVLEGIVNLPSLPPTSQGIFVMSTWRVFLFHCCPRLAR